VRYGTATLLLLVGCSGLSPEPIDPVKTESQFRLRRLDDPDFLSWLEAQGVARAPAWTPDALTLAAFYYHPDLDVVRARLLGSKAAESTAGEIPNPTVNGDLEKVLGSTVAGISPWVSGFNLQMPLDFLWKRGYRIEEAQAKTRSARLELAEAAWQVRRRVRAAMLEDLLLRREVALREAEAALRAETTAAAALLLTTGEASRLEADRARIEETVSGLLLEESRGKVAVARAALASAVGLPLAAMQDAVLEWSTLDAPPEEPAALREIGLVNRLDVRRALADYAATEAVLGLELAKQYPDITLGPGYLYDQGDRKITVGLSITLPIFNQNGGAIAEAEARRREAAARFVAVQARAIGEFDEAVARYRGARSRLMKTRGLTEAIERRLQGVRRAVELGEADRVTLLGVRIEKAATETARLEALRAAQEALGALEDAVQRPIDGSVPAFRLPDVPRKEKP
jgi:cobalt-zinc-cadmium efflux system outer membrane protein